MFKFEANLLNAFVSRLTVFLLLSEEWELYVTSALDPVLTETDPRRNSDTHIRASTQTQAGAHKPLLLCVRLWLARPGFLSDSLTSELEAAPPLPLPSINHPTKLV